MILPEPVGTSWPQAAAGDEARLDDLFMRQAQRTPDAIALEDGADRWTYGQVDALADDIARRLANNGVNPGGLVALDVDRRAATPVAIIGIMRVGAAYLPVNPDDPPERRRQILRDSNACAVVNCALTPRLAMDIQLLEQQPERSSPPAATAYVIYTSGSTGPPKGVMVAHSNVISLLAGAGPLFGFGPGDAWPAFHAYSFDVSVWEMWACLLHGGRLVIVPDAVARDPYQFVSFLTRTRASVINQVPTAFAALTRAVVHSRPELPCLRYVILAGEAIQPSALKAWKMCGTAPEARLINMYGITETTVHSTFADVSDVAHYGAGRQGSTFIGRALPHLRIKVVDEHLRDVAAGQTGEILIAGSGVALGYLNRPELTAARFVRGAEADQEQIWYRSGDLAFAGPDGLWYVGRNDHQVKIRGFRVELGEVEAVVRGVPEIDECAVIAPTGAVGRRSLVAFFTSSHDGPDYADVVRRALAEQLPSYMVPASLLRLPAMPHTSSGKIDRRRLEDHWLGRE